MCLCCCEALIFLLHESTLKSKIIDFSDCATTDFERLWLWSSTLLNVNFYSVHRKYYGSTTRFKASYEAYLAL